MLTRLTQLLVVFGMLIAAPLLAGSSQAQGDLPVRITPANVDRLELLDTIGTGELYDIGLLDGGATLAAVTQDGIVRYDPADLTLIDVIAYTENPFPDDGFQPYVNQDIGASTLHARYEDRRISFAWDRELWTIDTATGEQTRESLPDDYVEPEIITLSPDGQWEWTFSRDEVSFAKVNMLKNTTTGEKIVFEDTNCGGIAGNPAVVFSPDGSRLYTALGPDHGVIAVWDTATGAQIAAVGGYAVDARGIVFTPDGDTLWVARGDEYSFLRCAGGQNPGDGLYAYDLEAYT
ncbi:MAG: DUF1513 domain-containing protein, partial [Anaerolineae bacterium]|nr:DUF1513 domain-containing protein [Anaerolineae bacterium]